MCRRKLLTSVMLWVALAVPVHAQQEPAVTAQPAKSFVRWVYDAEGVFFFPQMGISIAIVALICSNILTTRRKLFVPQEFSSSFESHVKEKRFKEAYELAKTEPSFLGKLVAIGLQRLAVGYPEAIEAMEELGEEESMKYEHRLSYLALAGNIATLVGLLGTVWGMTASFMEIGKSDLAPKPSVLAQGVSQALVTTVLGLLQAIPAIIAFTFLKNRLAQLTLEVGAVSEQLMQPFKSVSARRAPDGGVPIHVRE